MIDNTRQEGFLKNNWNNLCLYWLFMKWAQESLSAMVPEYVCNYNKHKKSELSLQGSVWDIKCLKRMVFKQNVCKRKITVPRCLFVTQEGVHEPWRAVVNGCYYCSIALRLRQSTNVIRCAVTLLYTEEPCKQFCWPY